MFVFYEGDIVTPGSHIGGQGWTFPIFILSNTRPPILINGGVGLDTPMNRIEDLFFISVGRVIVFFGGRFLQKIRECPFCHHGEVEINGLGVSRINKTNEEHAFPILRDARDIGCIVEAQMKMVPLFFEEACDGHNGPTELFFQGRCFQNGG